jgi:lysophospholipase L1-like esterase
MPRPLAVLCVLIVAAPVAAIAQPAPSAGVPAAGVGAQAPAPQIGFPGQYAPKPADWKYPVWPSGCTRFQGPERTECLDFVASDYGNLKRFAAANAALAAPKPGEWRVVFFGDSITDGWSNPANGGFFPGRPYVNRGIGGQTTSQMLLRFRPDVVDLQPKVVVILAGTNDVAGNSGKTTPEAIQANLADMAEIARAHGIRVVLASLLPISDDKQGPNGERLNRSTDRPPATLRALNTWLADYAKRSGHVYLDYASAMSDSRGMLRSELTGDGLHPNAAGYAIMAPLAEKAIAKR